MKRIDTHQHFWQYHPIRDQWIGENMRVLQRDFMPEDLQPLLQKNDVSGCIAVQADQSEQETAFLLELAKKHPFIRGVVGWVDVRAKDLPERLAPYAGVSALKGFRHILQAEKPEFMLRPDFLNGIKQLGQHGYRYEILVFPRHLAVLKVFLKHFDHQPFVLDHLAKPYIQRGLIRQWAKDMRALARHENLYCKVSGLVTEADWAAWKPSDLKPYLELAFEAFGSKRVMYGSDWPVCLLAADYAAQKAVLDAYMAPFGHQEQIDFWGGNAMRFYGLEVSPVEASR